MKFSENDMELDRRIDGEDDEETSDGEIGTIGEGMVHTTHPHSFLSPYMLFFTEGCAFVVFVVMHIAGVWHIFFPGHWACYKQLKSKIKVFKILSTKLESNERVTISHVLYSFWQLLYKTKSSLRVDRIMSNNYVYAREFCIYFKKNY